MTIELGIYSGRPDPRWTLTPAQAAGLDAILAALPHANGTPPQGGLGYHGFTIIKVGGTLIAYRGAVTAPGTGSRAYLRDSGRSVEKYLLGTAGSSRLSAAQLAVVTADLAAGP